MTIAVLSVEDFEPPPALQAAWLAALPAARRAQLESWPEAGARRRSLLGSRLLWQALARLGYRADALGSLRYPPHGKPTLDLPVDFSLSHCAGRILCAISTSGPVGVDVEPLGALTAAAFSRTLDARERAWAGEDPRRFYELWTRKEAVVKAAGTAGLVRLRDVRIERTAAVLDGIRWYTATLGVGDRYVAHLAHASPVPAAAVEMLSAAVLCAG